MDFLNIFAKSPFKLLETHMTLSVSAAKGLEDFFQAALKKDWDTAAKLQRQISDFEHEADDLKKKVRLKVKNKLLMPVRRSDLLTLLTQQDKIANISKDIAGRVIGRQMAFPPEVSNDIQNYVTRSIDAARKAKHVIQELDMLLETGFSGREIQVVSEMVEELNTIEDDTDGMQLELRHKLYKIETNYPPLDMMFLYKIVEWIGELADISQACGNQLLILIAD